MFKKNKRIFTAAKIFIVLTFIVGTFAAVPTIGTNAETDNNAADDIIKHYTLDTSYDPTRYSHFTADGDTINAEGFYKDDVVTGVTLTNADVETDFVPSSDGTYFASLNAVPLSRQSEQSEKSNSPVYAIITVTLAKQGGMNYVAAYDGEWFFPEHPDNDSGHGGLAERHIRTVENYTEIPEDVVVQYLVGYEYNKGDIAATLNEINSIAETITEGIDDDYDKARAISAWVADNLYYDREARDTEVTLETIALKNVLANRRTVCSGYANLTAALNTAAGLKSVTVMGRTLSVHSFSELLTENNQHEWTAFFYEEEERWVLTDSGWDSYNYYQDGEKVKQDAPNKYFDISPLALANDHLPNKAEYRDWFSAIEFEEADEAGGLITAEAINTSPDGKPVLGNFARDNDNNGDSADREQILLHILIVIGAVLVVIIGIVIFMMFKLKKGNKP